MNLPKNEQTFMFSKEGEITGHKYDGQFAVKCVLSLADKRMLELEQSRLTGDVANPTDNLLIISRIVANLRVRILDAPDWFDQIISSLDIIDENILFDIYAECLRCSNEWIEKVRGKTEEKQKIVEGNSQAES